MALIKCPECQQGISDAAQFCPNCGFPIAKIARPETGEMIVVRRGFALAAAIIATVYVLFIVAMVASRLSAVSPYLGVGNEWVDIFAGMLIVHVLFLVVGVVLNFSGYISSQRYVVLAAAICYCVSALFFLLYLIFLVLPIVFGFVGYHRMKPKRVSLDEYILD